MTVEMGQVHQQATLDWRLIQVNRKHPNRLEIGTTRKMRSLAKRTEETEIHWANSYPRHMHEIKDAIETHGGLNARLGGTKWKKNTARHHDKLKTSYLK